MTMPSNTPASAVEAVIEKLEACLGMRDEEGDDRDFTALPITVGALEDAIKLIRTLTGALEPFAKIRADDGDTFQTYPRSVILRCEVTAGDIQDARQALGGVGE